MSFISGIGRKLVYLGVIAAMGVVALPHNSQAAPADQGKSRTFPETGKTVSGRILEVWEGGRAFEDSLMINGLPLTDLADQQSLNDGKIYKTQWFERSRFELHPENKAPYDVLLGLLGSYVAEGRKDTPFKAIKEDQAGGAPFYKETSHTLGDSSDGGKAIAAFWTKYGGVPQFGFPLSQPFQEVSKDPSVQGKAFLVQYFERQRLEYHPENKGSKFEVLLGRLGAEQMGQVPMVMVKAPGGNTPVDVLRIGRSQDPSVLLPYTDNTLVGSNMRAQIFNSLTTRDQDENVLPDLAYFVPTFENGGASYVGTGDDKRLVIKYKLKHGIKWADGQEFTSNDVIFTYKLILDPDFPATSRQTYQKFQSMDNPDKYTIIINFLTWKEAEALIKRDPDTYAFMQAYVDKKIPVADTLYSEVFGYVLPEHVLGKIAPQNIESSEYARLPWGTGPYKPTKFEKTTTIEMEANPNYNVNANVPFTKKLSFPYFRDNKQLPVGMDTATIDVAMSSGLDNDFLPALQAVADKGKVTLSTKASNTYEHIDFRVDKAPFNDVRVRQAVAHALDRDAINKALFAGRVTFINTWLSPNNWASIENTKNIAKFGSITSQLVKYPYNPDKAKALLDEAGWKVGADGIREKGGKKLKINWLTTNRAYRVLMAQVQQQYMKAIGIDSTPDVRPAGEVFADPPEGPLYSGSFGDFGVVEFAWAGTDEPGGTGLYDSTQIPSEANGFSGQNNLAWSNAASDKLLREAETLIGKSDERIKLYLEQQVIFSKEVPSIPLFLLTTISMHDKRLQNYQITSQGINLNINEWYLTK